MLIYFPKYTHLPVLIPETLLSNQREAEIRKNPYPQPVSFKKGRTFSAHPLFHKI
jgi:hypothetical protein